jgi:hypothetical protein
MKLKCGETARARQARLSDWHDHFLWWPTSIGEVGGHSDCRWLETVERKGVMRGVLAEDYYCFPAYEWEWDWEYRPKETK